MAIIDDEHARLSGAALAGRRVRSRSEEPPGAEDEYPFAAFEGMAVALFMSAAIWGLVVVVLRVCAG